MLARFTGRESHDAFRATITASNLAYVEELYAQYVENPTPLKNGGESTLSMDGDAGFADNQTGTGL